MNHVEELKRVILKNGYNPLFPILVTHDLIILMLQSDKHNLEQTIQAIQLKLEI